MLKICDSAIVKPLTILFKNCISQGIFPDNWKKSNICPIHKKGDKQVVNNYRPMSLLPICGKIFARLIFNSLYQFLEEHNFQFISLVFIVMTQVSTSFYLLSTSYRKLLMLTLLLIQDVIF